MQYTIERPGSSACSEAPGLRVAPFHPRLAARGAIDRCGAVVPAFRKPCSLMPLRRDSARARLRPRHAGRVEALIDTDDSTLARPSPRPGSLSLNS